jgi:hypothetical protein
VELHRVHLCAHRRDILLLELARLVALDEGRLADAAVAHEHELEFGHGSGRLSGRRGEGGGRGAVGGKGEGRDSEMAHGEATRQTSRAKRANRRLSQGGVEVLTILNSNLEARGG